MTPNQPQKSKVILAGTEFIKTQIYLIHRYEQTLNLYAASEQLREMKCEKQNNLESQNSWQQAKHTEQYSILHQTL